MYRPLVIISFYLFTCVSVKCQESNHAVRQHGNLVNNKDKLSTMEERILKMERKFIVQNNKIRKQENIIKDLQSSVGSCKLQENKLPKQNEDMDELRDRITELEHKSAMKTSTTEQTDIGTFTSLACESNIMRITCPANRTINITEAIYGQASQNYDFSCHNDCCPPHPNDDCFERVEDNSPQDWLALKYLCDANFECEFQYLGAIIPTCGDGYVADYMQAFFSCSPVDSKSPIGFTSYSTDTRVYGETELALFDDVISNYGGNFNPATSAFICPLDGIYLFTLQVVSQNSRVYATLMRETDETVLTWAESSEVTYNHGSNLGIIDCSVGQTIWVKISGGNIYGHTDKRTTFSGYLLYRY